VSRLRLLLAFALLCSGCFGGPGTALADPVVLAGRYAQAHNVDLSAHGVRSVGEFQNGKNSNMDSNQSDEFAKRLLGKLRGKRYWKVCYRTVERMLDGDQCYYVDRDSKELLVVYAGQREGARNADAFRTCLLPALRSSRSYRLCARRSCRVRSGRNSARSG